MVQVIVDDSLLHDGLVVSSCYTRSRGRRSFNHEIEEKFCNGELDLDGVVSRYRSWESKRVSMIFKREVFSVVKGLKKRNVGFDCRISRVSKRGDKLYSRRILKRFKKLEGVGKGFPFFDYHANDAKGSALLVTLEYDANVIDKGLAWHNVGKDLNRFLSYLRKKFGRIFDVRVFEAHGSGYPHIHLLLIFKHVFSGGRFWDYRKKRFVFRVKGEDFDIFKGAWFQGFSDFQLVNSFKGGLRYLSKYLQKSTCVESANDKGLKTLALCWLFRKRAFGFSGKVIIKSFFGNDVILRTLCNSNYKFGLGLVSGYSGYIKVSSKWSLLGFVEDNSVKWENNDTFSMDVSIEQLVLVRKSFADSRFDLKP